MKLGISYLYGDEPLPKDLPEALRHFEAACRFEIAAGCTDAGLMHARGKGVQANPTEALGFYARACGGGHASGCNNLGIALHLAQGTERRGADALRAFKRGCELDPESNACPNLARLCADDPMPGCP